MGGQAQPSSANLPCGALPGAGTSPLLFKLLSFLILKYLLAVFVFLSYL